MVKRYDPMSATGEAYMVEMELGDYVRAEAYDALAAERDAINNAQRELYQETVSLKAERDDLLAIKDAVKEQRERDRMDQTLYPEVLEALDAWEARNE